jgi:hypothetical protein
LSTFTEPVLAQFTMDSNIISAVVAAANAAQLFVVEMAGETTERERVKEPEENHEKIGAHSNLWRHLHASIETIWASQRTLPLPYLALSSR